MTDRPIIFSAPMVRALLDGRKTQTRRILKLPPVPEHLGEWQVSTIGGAGVTDSRGKPVPEQPCAWHSRTGATVVPRYQAGDRLHVRESWRVSPEACEGWHPDIMQGWIDYQAGGSLEVVAPSMDAVEKAAFLTTESRDWDFIPHRYRPSIHMPRWASRLTLIVEDIRVERLNHLTEADAVAEGIESYGYGSIWGWIDYTETNPNMTRCLADPRASFETLWQSLHGDEAWEANPFVVAVGFRVERGNIDQIGSVAA